MREETTLIQRQIDVERPRRALVVGIHANNIQRSREGMELTRVNSPLRTLHILPLVDAVLDNVLRRVPRRSVVHRKHKQIHEVGNHIATDRIAAQLVFQ